MKTAMLIGRFQPLHLGHLSAIEHALRKADRLVLVIGSSQKSHEYRNPFTSGERMEMIITTLDNRKLLDRTVFAQVPDVENHALWVPLLKSLTPKFDFAISNDPLTIRLLEEAGTPVEEAPFLNREELVATEVRRRIATGGDWQPLVPPEVASYIRSINGVERIKALFAQQDANSNNKKV